MFLEAGCYCYAHVGDWLRLITMLNQSLPFLVSAAAVFSALITPLCTSILTEQPCTSFTHSIIISKSEFNLDTR